MDINLRQIKEAEFDATYEILHESAMWLLSKEIIQWPLDWLESIRTAIKASIDAGLFYAVEIDNNLAAVCEITFAPEVLWNNNQTEALYIHKLAIRRHYANQNLGRNILHLIMLEAKQRNIHLLRLDCVAHNNKLRQYYESCGFNLKGVVETKDVNLALYEQLIER